MSGLGKIPGYGPPSGPAPPQDMYPHSYEYSQRSKLMQQELPYSQPPLFSDGSTEQTSFYD